MTLAEAVAAATANAAGKRGRSTSDSMSKPPSSDAPAAKSLVDMHAEAQAASKKAKKEKAEWEGQHPWKPWNRETDLDIRGVNPKGKESILNNQHMGTLKDRFGGGRRETSFM